MDKHNSKETGDSKVNLLSAENTTLERFVVFLDIMGFKDRVARYDHDIILKELQIFQYKISSYVRNSPDSNIQLVMFSDSILLFSQDISASSLRAISDVANHIMMYAMQQERPIPLKGAIAAGKMTCDYAKQLYFGQALIDAYLLEEDVKYYGVIVHHTAEKYVKMYNFDNGLFRDNKTPLKSGDIFHYELVWYETKLPDEEEKDGIAIKQIPLTECLKNLRLTVSDEPRKYIDNTKKVMVSEKEK